MRNGNHACGYDERICIFCSYPTYEEWKPYVQIKISAIIDSSYPTYEEWKHFIIFTKVFKKFMFLSYLWGMETKMDKIHKIQIKTFLSYLWGMETHWKPKYLLAPDFARSYPTYEEWKHSPTLIIIITSFKFLSYLWGMETTKSKI